MLPRGFESHPLRNIGFQALLTMVTSVNTYQPFIDLEGDFLRVERSGRLDRSILSLFLKRDLMRLTVFLPPTPTGVYRAKPMLCSKASIPLSNP